VTDSKAKKKVLITSHDKIGSSMAGPGIRYHYMAQTLSDHFDVTVGFFDPSYLPEPGFDKKYSALNIPVHDFEVHFRNFDIVISHWLSEDMLAFCNSNGIFMVFDMYVPGPVENLAGSLFGGKPVAAENDFEYNRALAMYRKFFENGDLFLVSNRRQLDFWIGYIFGADQVHLSTYKQRPLYDRFIYGPMGIDTRQPLRHTKDVIKGVIPGISKRDKVLLWTGGIWNHFDGQVLIRAMKQLETKHPDIKLVFFGTQHPNPSIPEMKESLDTRKLSGELGLTDKTVFFKDGWVKYPERINYLLEADVAVSIHKASIETEFAHRTRILDHLLAELPTVATKGDYFSDEVIAPNQLGLVVPAGDDGELGNALAQILQPKLYASTKKNIKTVRADFDWARTMEPLVNFLLDGPAKMEILDTSPKLKTRSRPMRLARRLTPIPVKKAVIRTLKMR
jgi:glycosyltransferase involved in cell wall biosynthesis